MAFITRARAARSSARRRFARRDRHPALAYRAVTLGPRADDWAVIGPEGEVVYRGYAVHAARMASDLARTR